MAHLLGVDNVHFWVVSSGSRTFLAGHSKLVTAIQLSEIFTMLIEMVK